MLPGLDDGPATVEDAVELTRVAASTGTHTLVATPHIDNTWGVDPASVPGHVAALNDVLRARRVGVELVQGGEVTVERALTLDDDALAGVRLGGGPWLLVESPLGPSPGLERMLFELQVRGVRMVLAHVERSPAFQRDPDALRALVEGGALSQITASSLEGRFGRTARRAALDFVRQGLVHDVASDAHDASHRPPGLRAALEGADGDVPGLATQIAWLTEEVPAAILAGRPLPVRPELPRPRRKWLRG